jgi:LPXTG-site transpeptidase (sortase) family protein
MAVRFQLLITKAFDWDLNLPDLAIELPLFDTTNDDLLEQGATVLDGTSFPVGGASTMR